MSEKAKFWVLLLTLGFSIVLLFIAMRYMGRLSF